MSTPEALTQSGLLILFSVAAAAAIALWFRFCVYRIDREWLSFACSFAPILLILWVALAIAMQRGAA